MNSTNREYPDRPMVGIGVVVWHDSKVLLVKRAQLPRQGEWALPGGAQELGETLFQAAAREVLEETAIVVEPCGVITAIDLIERDAEGVRFHYTLIEIAARYVSGEIAAGEDATECAWVAPENIPALEAWDEVERVVTLSRRYIERVDCHPGKSRDRIKIV